MAFLWKISKENHPDSYFFGTIHAICKHTFYLPENVRLAIEKSETIWLEINLNDAENQKQNIFLMQNEIPLEEALSPEDFKWFSTHIIEKHSIDYESIRFLKPIFILYQLAQYFIPCETISFEEKIVQIAMQQQKEIKGLSSLQEQYDLGNQSFTHEDFMHIIRHIQFYNFEQMYADIVVAYNKEDVEELQKLIKEQSFENEKIQSILLEKRNLLWLETLRTVLQNKSAFVAVGIAHLTGELGLVSLLEKQGFKITKM